MTLAVSGCAPARGVSVPLGADELAPCEGASINVEDLEAAGEPGCNLAGSSLTFPDGVARLAIPQVGSVFSHQDSRLGNREILIVNWGVPGVAAAIVEGDQLLELWASGSAALDLHRQQLRLEGIDAD
ncbi:hypothetical protein [Microbacterium sp. Root166]|uniref:hypothetical protein n=1 Tax=Microbacterium sp. Root166 TaxID=1736478 RepID=UPI0012F8A7C1|nr:hypothetical protein [Microbacterium sp. Root166]